MTRPFTFNDAAEIVTPRFASPSVEDALSAIDRQMEAHYAKRGLSRPSWVPEGPWLGLADSMALAKREEDR